MRLWSLHPALLDRAGLVALWREALLAQAVLRGATKGYRHHPQLDRFKACSNPVGAIGLYLRKVHDEAQRRGFRFDAEKIRLVAPARVPVTKGQLAFEFDDRVPHMRGDEPIVSIPSLANMPSSPHAWG